MVMHVSFRKLSKSSSKSSSSSSFTEEGTVEKSVTRTAKQPSKRRIQPLTTSRSTTRTTTTTTNTTASGMRTIIVVISLLSSSLFCHGLSSTGLSTIRHGLTSHRRIHPVHGAPRMLDATTETTSTTTTTTTSTRTTSLSAVSSTHTAVLDGSEWTSVQRHLTLEGSSDAADVAKQQRQQRQRQNNNNNRNKQEPNVGILTIVTGTLQDDTVRGRVVAVQAQVLTDNNNKEEEENEESSSDNTPVSQYLYLSDSVAVYADSVAAIPDPISDVQAAATYAASISWHTVWQQAVATTRNIGGDTSGTTGTGNGTTDNDKDPDFNMPMKAVVVGGSRYAVTAAAALAALGATVTVISTGTPNLNSIINQNAAGANANTAIAALPPATGELQISFCNVLGKFDLLLDTLGNERDDDDSVAGVGSSVLRFLKDRHDCHSYGSTVTAQQAVVNRQGVLWGPGKAKTQKLNLLQLLAGSGTRNSMSFVPPANLGSFVPPANLGRTVQTILQAGVVVDSADKGGSTKDGGSLLVRDWSLPDYWELVTWPRDSAGGANVRYGFPVPDDLSLVFEDGVDGSGSDYVGADEDDNEDMTDMISAPPLRGGRLEEETMQPSETPEGSNPYILNVVGVQGLQKHVIESERDCLLFLSAPFCRTCRYLQPQYQRMARMGTEEWDGAVTFAKADAGGAIGKELGRALKVDAVPSFLLFRKGRLYGEPLSISRLPSRKLDLAVDFMKSGKPWDEQALREVDQDSKKNPRRPPPNTKP